MILTPFQIWPDSALSTLDSFLCFRSDSIAFGLRYILCFPSDSVISGYVSLWLPTICFMFLFHLSLCFPRTHYVSVLHFFGLRSFPSTLSYCTSLSILRSHSCIPLRRFRSLVYISRVLVATNLRTNITCFSLVSLWVSSVKYQVSLGARNGAWEQRGEKVAVGSSTGPVVWCKVSGCR